MPVPLPRQPRRNAVAAAESVDCLALWALSVGFASALIATIAYFSVGDQIGAALVLFAGAAIIALVLRTVPPPKSERD